MQNDNLPNEFASWLTINRACNLNCEWCYANPERFKGEANMSLETVQKSINLFKGLPLKRVILIGGEPTIHQEFLTIVKIIKTAGLVPVVITNGVKFRDKFFLSESLRAGISGITVSLKGSSDEQYAKLTGRAAFSDVIVAMKNIVESGVDHNLSITIGDELGENFDDMIAAILKSGTKWFSIDMERPLIICNKAVPSKLSPKQMADFFVKIYPSLERCGIDFVLKISIPFCLFPEGFIEKANKQKRIVSGCHIYVGRGIIIDPKGKLLPCNHFCDNPLGELGVDFSDEDGYIRFRNRPDIKEFYETLASYPHKNCQFCHDWQQCGAGCRVSWLCREASELISIQEERR